MDTSLQDSFDRSCRLCAEEQDVTIMIFSAEAQAMLLQNKLNKYLLIEVDENDKLPKNICVRCCTKLQSVCNFIDTAHKAQTILLDRSIMLDQIVSDDFTEPNRKEEIKDEPESYFDDETVTEMEVSVDPMMVLQNSDDGSCPVLDDNSQTHFEDLTYLHGLDGENVTIKLIKRADTDNMDCNELIETKTDPLAKPFQCIICKRGFLTELALKNHSWIHFNDEKYSTTKDFQCPSCELNFEYKNDLIFHLKEHRSSGTCKICGRCFRSEENLALHMESHITPANAYICNVCGRAYHTSSNLKTHSITHSNERPYKCHICNKSFKRNQDLKFHINQHTGAKPYKCPFCDKCFASSGNCYSHRSRMHPGRRLESKGGRGRRRTPTVSQENQPIRTVVPPKLPMIGSRGVFRYRCQFCDHTFLKRDNFTYHMYQHTGEKPFHCSICPEKFVTRRGLLLHHDKEHHSRDRPLALISKNVLLK